MDAAKRDKLTNEVLRNLDWTSLRTRYRHTCNRSQSQFDRFAFDALDYCKVQNWKEMTAVAATLNGVPAIADRVGQLKKAGVTAELHSYEESGFSALMLTVTFDDTGRSALEEG
ncbi:MAG TPA: hypothetical protein VMG39_10805 [Pseudolabrys sp.]|nr:hypothetical protein [Pseudolabrys sp.]